MFAALTFALQVKLICEPLSLDQQNEGDLIIEGLYLQSTGWDNDTGSLIPSEEYISEMPNVCIRAVTEEEMTIHWAKQQQSASENGAETQKDERELAEKDQYNFYNCPIFTTKVLLDDFS